MKVFSKIVVGLCFTLTAFASTDNECYRQMSAGPVPINNQEVLHWKATTENHFARDSHISGVFQKKYPEKDFGGERFQIKIGPKSTDTIEIYHNGFDKLPRMKKGDKVVACGLYVTSTEDDHYNEKSPDGAFITETSASNNAYDDDGFLLINGVRYAE